MTLQEQYTRILDQEHEKELIPFLKSLSPEQRKALSLLLPPLAKAYFETEVVTSNGRTHYRTKGTPARRRILQLAAFVCCNRGDYEKVDPWGGVIEPQTLGPVLEWYCPDWLNVFVNQYA